MIKEYVPKIKKTLKKLSYLFLIELFIFTTFVGYEFIIWRKNINILNSKSQELTQKSEKFVELNRISKESEDLMNKIDESLKRIFTRDEFENFIITLPNTISNYNLRGVEISLSEEKLVIEGKNYYEVNIYLSFDGSYENGIKFIKYIENLDKIIDIKNFSLTLIDKEKNYSFNLSLIIPFTS